MTHKEMSVCLKAAVFLSAAATICRVFVRRAVHRCDCSFILGVTFRIVRMRILILSDLHSNATATRRRP